MTFKLDDLPYSYDSLEPHIDAKTMEIHYSKHHNGYCKKLNAAVEGTLFENMPIEQILIIGANELPAAVRNNGGGFANHNLFWKVMNPNGGGTPTGDLGIAINDKFESFEKFKENFTKSAASHFGSGWTWLVFSQGNLEITTTSNQDSPLMNEKIPLLGLDIWEHAYYLKYQNRRSEYITAWWNVVDWNQVLKFFIAARDLPKLKNG